MPKHEVITLGAVAYDAKVVTIWDGFRRWFTRQGLPFDYVLYSNYERQVEDLMRSRIDVAWNSPLAWVRARRMGDAAGQPVEALVMRDTDCNLSSVVVVKDHSPIHEVDDLRGRTVAVGAVDSPQATLLPLDHLRSSGLSPGHDFEVRRFDVGVGLHGDHIGGERDAALALARGEVDAACMTDGNHVLFIREGSLPAAGTRILTQTGVYDHCNVTVRTGAPAKLVERLGELLLAMDYGDADVRPLLDLEGLKEWRQGRLAGYAPLEQAVDAFGFYSPEGVVTADDYRP